MSFSSLSFLYSFLPIVILLYFVCRSHVWKNGVLLLASLLFYSWGDPRALLLLIISSFAAFLAAQGIEHLEKHRRAFLAVSSILLIGILVYYKYLNFILENLSSVSGYEFSFSQLALPAGISFYTFQLLSYLFDVYKRKISCERNFFRFLLYVSFFPQLIQGPIVRYENIRSQLLSRQESWDGAICGSRRFIVGLAKKVLIADNIALIATTVYSAPELSGTGALWLAALSYTLQLYFDFSGYCDMAIGLGKIFGFTLPENFNYPYASTSITDFWRRWHITLSLWFRDYIYIPLGGNRCSRFRFMLNLLIVWGLTGLWHGASWNFVLWGLYYGVLLLIEKLLIGDKIDSIPMLLRRAVTLTLVTLGWVLFNLSDTSTLLSVLEEMFVFSPTDWIGLVKMDTSICSKLFIFPAALVFAFPVAKKIRFNESSISNCLISNLVHLGLLAFSIMYIISSNFTPFIYFSF